MHEFSDLLNAGTFGFVGLVAWGAFVFCAVVKAGSGKWPWDHD